MLVGYRGDTGLDDGQPQSVYSVSPEQIADGSLDIVDVDPTVLSIGESWELDDGTEVTFEGVLPMPLFRSVKIRRDSRPCFRDHGPDGIVPALTVKRRRIWVRVGPDGTSLGGLTRTEYDGFDEEFHQLADIIAAESDSLRRWEVSHHDSRCRAGGGVQRHVRRRHHFVRGRDVRYAVEYAFGRKNRLEQPARQPVTVGGPPDVSESPDESDENDHEQNNLNTNLTPAQAVLTGRVATVAMVLGALAHIASVLLRGLAANRWPWGNMFEFIVAVCLAGVIAWIVVVARKLVARRLGLFTMLTTVIMLGVATRVYTEAGPLVPALDSYWIAIHVLAAIVAFGIFMVGFVTAVLHLIKRRWVLLTERRKRISFPFTLGQRLPLPETLERITWRLHVLAFPLWTFGVIAGAVWLGIVGPLLGMDPKEVWSFVAWVVYAATCIHEHRCRRRRWAPWIAIVGWAVVLFNLFA